MSDESMPFGEPAGLLDLPPKPEEFPPPPLEPPRPLTAFERACKVAIPVVVVGGAVLFLLEATAGRTRGSTQSYRLKCEQRDQQIAAEIQAQEQDQLNAASATVTGKEMR